MKKRTITSITTIANTEIKTITVIITVLISLYIINHIALYIIKKAANYRTTLRKNKKSLKLSSGLLIKTNLVNLITDLTNNLINTL